MAYQPKNYKKFVATAATATLVASAIAPAAFADQASTSAFTDVGDRYEEAVEYVVTNGIAKGVNDTQFGVGASITRGDAAIMIAQAAGLMDEKAPASGFSDVPKRGAIAINSLKAAGITNGLSTTKFGWSDSITRGEAARLLVKAFELTGGDVSDMKFTDVGENHRFAKEIAALVENGITDGESTTKFGTQNSIKRGDYAIFLHRISELKDPVKPAPVATEVASVSALNATHVAVKFNNEVNAASAKNLNNYVFTKNNDKFGTDYDEDTSAAVKQALVLADGKTVVFELEDALNQGDKYGVDVKNAVKGKDGVSIEAYGDTQREFKDQAAPVIQDTEYSATDKSVTLYYNEPVSFDDADFGINIDGNEIASEDIDYKTLYNTNKDGKVTDILYTVTVDVSDAKDLYAVGDHEVIIYNLRDEVKSTAQAGNKIQIASTTYKVVKQESVAVDLKVEDVVGKDFNSLEVKFNKVAKNAKVTVYHGNTKFYEQSVSDSQNIKVDLPYTVMSTQNGITPLYAVDANSSDIRVVVEDIEDANKVIGDKYEKEITLNRDSAKPTASKSEVTVDYDVNEDTGLLTQDSTPTITIPLTRENNVYNSVKDFDLTKQVTVTDVNGVQRTLENVDLVDGNKLVIELAKDSGTKQKFEDLLDFKVSVKANSLAVDTDVIDVESPKSSSTIWDENDTTNTLYNDVINITAVKKSKPGQPGDTNFKYIEGVKEVDAVDNVITVEYKGSMTASAALIENYSIDGKAFPQGTSVSMDATSKVVTITLPEGSVAKTQDVRLLISKEVRTLNNEVIVGSITDKEMYMTKEAITLYDNVAPLLTSAAYVEGNATAKTTKNLEFTFSEALYIDDLDALEDSLVVEANGTKAVEIESSKAGKANKDGEVNTVIVTLKEDVTTTQKATITVDKDEDQVITDIQGNLLSTGTVVEVKANDVKKAN